MKNKSDLAREFINKYIEISIKENKKFSKSQLAKLLIQEHPDDFTNAENARSVIRRVLGSNGEKSKISKNTSLINKFNSLEEKINNIGEKTDLLFTQRDNSATLSGQAKTLDDLLRKANIDMRIWEVDTFEIKDNSWDVTMKNVDKELSYTDGRANGYTKQVPGGDTIANRQYYIKARLKKREDYLEFIVDDYIKDIPKFDISHFTPKHNVGSGIALEMATLDPHFGKLAWMGETSYRNYDLSIAAQDYEYAVDKNLNWSSHEKIEKIFFIIGQDLFHVDNMKNHTTNGDHTMDVDGRIPKIFRKIFQIVTESIYKCRQVAPVEVIWSPGNHDYLASMMLCFSLEQHFKDDPFVFVDIERERDGLITRKARLWGNLLVGWTHRIKGRENTWGNELAQQFPQLWGQSKFREWHCGDQHLKKTTKLTPEFTSGGVVIRQLTALSPVDKWHFENLFTDAVPGGEAFLWSKDYGVYANYVAWTGQYDEYRNKLIDENR